MNCAPEGRECSLVFVSFMIYLLTNIHVLPHPHPLHPILITPVPAGGLSPSLRVAGTHSSHTKAPLVPDTHPRPLSLGAFAGTDLAVRDTLSVFPGPSKNLQGHVE